MKTQRTLVVGLVLVAAFAANAQDIAHRTDKDVSNSRENVLKVPDLKKAEMNYLINLNSDLPQIVESALGHVTLMRIAYPKQDMRKIQVKLYDLASQGATKSIRQKAFTAMQVFANPTAYKGAIQSYQASGDGLLESLAAQM